MLKNNRVTALTVCELLRERQERKGLKLPPYPRLNGIPPCTMQREIELLLYEAEKVIAKIKVDIQGEVNEKNPEKFERKYVELEGQHSRFQRKLDQRRRKK